MSATEGHFVGRKKKEPTGEILKALWLVAVKHYTQAQAGKAVGLSRTTVGKWLRRYKMSHGKKKSRPQILRFCNSIEDKVTKKF